MSDFQYDIKKEYDAFLKERETTPMEFVMGNQVLYDMCKKYPHHDDTDIIVSKIWLIGRSYAAAIERRKTDDNNINEDFMYSKVAPVIKRRSKKIDSMIDELNSLDGNYKDNVETVLELHKYLMDTFKQITGLEKRSLASKYLHFHCPDKVLIYDSRAKESARKVVHRPNINPKWKNKYDEQYADFCARIIAMVNEIGTYPTPREIDSFLLHHVNKLERSHLCKS